MIEFSQSPYTCAGGLRRKTADPSLFFAIIGKPALYQPEGSVWQRAVLWHFTVFDHKVVNGAVIKQRLYLAVYRKIKRHAIAIMASALGA